MMERDTHDIVIVGGGPAGMMAGMLFARAGLSVCVLEKHKDFFRDFRGDTVHPSTMELLDELGMLDRFLERPHNRVMRAVMSIAGKNRTIAEFAHLHVRAPFIAMMPQWHFLDFLREEASAFPGFDLRLEAQVAAFDQQDGRITGVRLKDGSELRARKLVIAADGRSSIVREQGLMEVHSLGAPMDVFWFSITKTGQTTQDLRASLSSGRMVILIDRDDYWQCALLLSKGDAADVLDKGPDWAMEQVKAAYPDVTFEDGSGPTDTDDLKLLVVQLDRLKSWHRPGLLAIGDAAHAMSPIGGVGINLAIQDAVAAANILAGPLSQGEDASAALLARVQKRRERPMRLVQAGQRTIQNTMIDKVLSGTTIEKVPLPVRALDRFPWLRRIPGAMIGLGIRREHIRSPKA